MSRESHDTLWLAGLVVAFSLPILSALIDRVGARPILLWSSVASAAVSLSLPFFIDGYVSALILFSFLAAALAGTYTPGPVLFAGRFIPEGRGWAIGWFLGSSSLGYAVALGLAGLMMVIVGWRAALFALALGPGVGAALTA